MENKDWNSNEMFLSRYQSMSYAQQYMTGEAFDEAEKWLRENNDRYVDLLLHRNNNK